MRFLLVFFIILNSFGRAQVVKGIVIDSVLKLDSIISSTYQETLNLPEIFFHGVNKNENNLVFEMILLIEDYSKKIKQKYIDTTAILSLDCLTDTSILTRFLSEAKINNEIIYNYFKRIIKLIDENKISSITLAGIGDCASCCLEYKFESNCSIIVTDKRSCGNINCYYQPRNTCKQKIKNNVYLICRNSESE